VLKISSGAVDLNKAPEDGCYIYGLFLDGASWDENSGCLADSEPKKLYSKMSHIWLIPSAEKKDY